MEADAAIFHSGDVQSGISRAIAEGKVVACLVRADDDHDSQVWEEFWLAGEPPPGDMFGDAEPPLARLLQGQAVLLRMDYGSAEAAFLAAFCPVDKVPTMVVIRNGQVLDKLEAGVTKEQFRASLMSACGLGGSAAPSQQAGAEQAAPQSPSSANEPPAPVRTLLGERAARLEADRQRREAAEQAERTARANARRQEAEQAAASDKGKQRATDPHEKQQARDAWIVQQKQRKDEAKKERARILAQIENDKQERRAQAQRQREAQTAAGAGAFSVISDASTTPRPTLAPAGSSCALQIRLFDGSSIRGKFDPDTTLDRAVRTWIKEASPQGGADIPYTFRQILAPQPSRSIEVSEEHQSLQDLGLWPTATLVLVPVAGYTNAYDSAGGGYLWSAASWCASLIGSAVSYIPGVGRIYMAGADAQEPPVSGGVTSVPPASSSQFPPTPDSTPVAETLGGIKVKTLFDQRGEQEQQKGDKAAEFYNGNSSAFQGNGPGDQDDAR